MPPIAIQRDATLHDAPRTEYALELFVGSEDTVIIKMVVAHFEIFEQTVQHTIIRAHGIHEVELEPHVSCRIPKHFPKCLFLTVESFADLVVKYHLSLVPYIFHLAP